MNDYRNALSGVYGDLCMYANDPQWKYDTHLNVKYEGGYVDVAFYNLKVDEEYSIQAFNAYCLEIEIDGIIILDAMFYDCGEIRFEHFTEDGDCVTYDVDYKEDSIDEDIYFQLSLIHLHLLDFETLSLMINLRTVLINKRNEYQSSV